MPDIRLRQSARFPRGQIQVTVPDLFSDWIAPIWVEQPESAPFAPGYEVILDWKVTDGVIDETQALATAVMVALGSNLLADVGDELPDPLDNDRQGWWGTWTPRRSGKVGRSVRGYGKCVAMPCVLSATSMAPLRSRPRCLSVRPSNRSKRPGSFLVTPCRSTPCREWSVSMC